MATTASAIFASILLAGVAQARPARFFLDGAVGVTVPLGEANYSDVFRVSPDFGLHLGGEFWVTPRLALGPELALDGGPLLEQHSSSVTTGRLRIQPGLRVLVGFGNGHAFFLRYLLGTEAFVYGPGGRQSPASLNFGFATEAGAGMQFRVSSRGVVGFTVGVPLGLHSFGTSRLETDFDFAATVFAGLRR